MSKYHIKGLDGLRAIAVSLVLINHLTLVGQRALPGGFGVHLFFVLSGFLIIGILRGRRIALDQNRSSFQSEITQFYENRVFRIWPPYFLTITAGFLISYLGGSNSVRFGHIIASVTFTLNLWIGYIWGNYPKLGWLWSISVEEQFYLWAAPAFLLLAVHHHWKICVAVLIVALLVGVASLAPGTIDRSVYVGSFTNFGLMAIGGMASMIKPKQWMVRAAPFALALFVIWPFAAYTFWTLPRIGSILSLWVSTSLVPIVLMGLVGSQNSLLVKLLDIRPMRYIGKISYGIYLYHPLVDVRAIDRLIGSETYDGPLKALCAIGVASLSWRFFEKPFLDFRDRRRFRRAERHTLDVGLEHTNI